MPCLRAYAPSGIRTQDPLITSREHEPLHHSAHTKQKQKRNYVKRKTKLGYSQHIVYVYISIYYVFVILLNACRINAIHFKVLLTTKYMYIFPRLGFHLLCMHIPSTLTQFHSLGVVIFTGSVLCANCLRYATLYALFICLTQYIMIIFYELHYSNVEH